jgi:hypothetical protein
MVSGPLNFGTQAVGASTVTSAGDHPTVSGHFSCSGTPLVNVTARIRNEGDGGVAGQVWALLDVVEHAKIWQESVTQFCVVETDLGTFHAFAGKARAERGRWPPTAKG